MNDLEASVRDAMREHLDDAPTLDGLMAWAGQYEHRERSRRWRRPLIAAAAVALIVGVGAQLVRTGSAPVGPVATAPSSASSAAESPVTAMPRVPGWRDYIFTADGAKYQAVIQIPGSWPATPDMSCFGFKSNGVFEIKPDVAYAACHDGDAPNVSRIMVSRANMSVFMEIDEDKATQSTEIDGHPAKVGRFETQIVVVIPDANVKMSIKSPDASLREEILANISLSASTASTPLTSTPAPTTNASRTSDSGAQQFMGPFCGQSVQSLALLADVGLDYELDADSIALGSPAPGVKSLAQNAYFAVVDQAGRVVALGPSNRDVQSDRPVEPGVTRKILYSPPTKTCAGDSLVPGRYTVVAMVEHVATREFYRTPAIGVDRQASGWVLPAGPNSISCHVDPSMPSETSVGAAWTATGSGDSLSVTLTNGADSPLFLQSEGPGLVLLNTAGSVVARTALRDGGYVPPERLAPGQSGSRLLESVESADCTGNTKLNIADGNHPGVLSWRISASESGELREVGSAVTATVKNGKVIGLVHRS